MAPHLVTSSDDRSLVELCDELARLANQDAASREWPAAQLNLCAEAGVFAWFVPLDSGGQGWSDEAITQGYLQLSKACLTTTFVITQLTGACRRIAAMPPTELRHQLLSKLLVGDAYATLAISHLTTSRRHLKQPVLRATEVGGGGFLLSGYSPWVTGGCEADYIVTGATLPDDRQLLVAVPTDCQGVEPDPPATLMALGGSRTGAVQFRDVRIEREWLLSEPAEDVMQLGIGGRTGGLQTSTLALGLASGAVDYIQQQADKRADLSHPAEQLLAELDRAVGTLRRLARSGTADASATGDLRAMANSLVLRAAQAALVAAKGAGFIEGHPAGRWCREALFFLVWSCPQPVLDANLCELAGLRGE